MVSLPRRSEPAGVTEEILPPSLRMYSATSAAVLVGDVEAEAAAGALENFDGFENVLFAFFAEAGNVAQFAFAGEFFDVLDRAGLEFLPEERDLFRAEALERENVENRRGIFLQELLAEAVVAGLENFVDVIGHAFADAGKFGELVAVFGEIFDATRECWEAVRRRVRSCDNGR